MHGGIQPDVSLDIFLAGAKSTNCGIPSLPSGSIQTPNYPNDYPLGVYCEWQITQGSTCVVTLSVTDFLLEDNSCSWDYLIIEHEKGSFR